MTNQKKKIGKKGKGASKKARSMVAAFSRAPGGRRFLFAKKQDKAV